MRKVFGILAVQLLLTAGIVTAFVVRCGAQPCVRHAPLLRVLALCGVTPALLLPPLAVLQ